MKKTRIMIGLVFMVAFAAGVSSALLARQFAEPSPKPRGPWMTAELKLTPEQEKQMQEIWGTLGRSGWHEESENRRALQKQRDDSIKALIPAERQADLEKLLEDYQRQMNELSQQRKQRFEAAVEKTKAMLTPEQRDKYESILARRPDGPRRGGPHGPPVPPTHSGMGGLGPKPAEAPERGPEPMDAPEP